MRINNTPIFNGSAGWQLYHGDGYGAPVDYFFNEWMHVKIIVSGSRGEVYIMDMEKPAVLIHEMKHGIKSGQVGLMCANYAPAYFSNFSFTPVDNPRLKGEPKHPERAPEGTIMAWTISNLFDEKSLANKFHLEKRDKDKLKWKKLTCENSGLANLSSLHAVDDKKNTVFAKININSNNEQIKLIKLGYSDRIKIYFNDKLLYGGNNNFQSRDYRFLGTIGYFDELYLPLKKGYNELMLAVSESFGGWGIKARFENLEGIEIRN